LHAVLSERSAVSPELALRLGTFLGNGPQLWIEMQSRYDLWQAERKFKKNSASYTCLQRSFGSLIINPIH
jgi:plasmid maintenance system antidote protein VapI